MCTVFAKYMCVKLLMHENILVLFFFPPSFLSASSVDVGVSHLLTQHKTIDSVLERGEKLDSLVEKSSDLSAASQVHL